MNKFNKKGFTLIEMLVVIAIIAILVSIVVPVVSNSTNKAAAAANAANLRTVAAQVGMWKLEDPALTTVTCSGGKATATVNSVERSCDAPVSKKVAVTTAGADGAVAAGKEMTITIAADNVTATYDGVTIAQFAAVADGTVK